MHSLSIRSLLAAFAVAILAPTLLLTGLLVWRFVDQERRRAESDLSELARGVLLSIDRDLVGIESALQALTTSRALKRGDYESFYRQASEAKAFNGTNVVARDLNGQQLINTRLPFGAPLPIANSNADRRAAETRGPYVSDLIQGSVAAQPLFLVNAPVFSENGSDIIAFVNMSVPPERVRDVIQRANRPAGWSVAVIDRTGRIVSRVPEHDAFMGKPAEAAFLAKAQGPQGWSDGDVQGDAEMLTAYARSPRFGWLVAVSAPRALLNGPLRRSLLALGGLTTLLLALSAGLAYGFGRRIAGPIQALERQAAAIGRGERAAAEPRGLAEADVVGRALAQAADAAMQERASLETLNAVGRDLAAELDRNRLVQRVIDAATMLAGAAYGAFFERVPPSKDGDEEKPESWRLFALSGAPLEAFTRFGMPRATNVFAPTFHGEGVVRSDDIAADPRYGSHGGMPKGHLPVRSYLAVAVRSRSGEILGALLFGHPEPGRFGPREERLAEGIAGQAAIALDNASLFNAAQAEIVQRRMAERALAAAKTEAERVSAMREAILSQLGEGVIVADPDGRIIFVNEAAQRLHGGARLDVAPEEYSETYRLFTLDGRPHPIEDLPLAQAVMRGETVTDARWRIRRPDGSEILAVGSARPVLGPEGERLGAVLTLRDDTGRDAAEREQRRLAEALAERAADLKESNDELQRYAYIVSHDLRAPLVNVMGFTNELRAIKPFLLAAGTKPPGDPARAAAERDFDESIAFIDVAVAKMEALIAAILKLAREGRRTFRPEPIAMSAMVQDLADAIRHQIEEAGAKVTVAPDLPDVVADRLALQQIFGNLIDNAVKYLEPTRPGRIAIEGETLPGGRVWYRIKDNGRGIARSDYGRVFELFRRSGRQDQPGEGIGLAHVKALVRALGGRIGVESDLGLGTTFSIILPQAAAAEGAGAAERATTAA
jgi:PAS domain S-box-containing protein